MKTIIFLVLYCAVLCTVRADIVTDGSLGERLALAGDHYEIPPTLGQTVGNHLFHSFAEFNLAAGESATFSGVDTVQNVISRVTGGMPSHINGLLRSTIPNANLYLINPHGVIFGEQAQLDVKGSFHASTADYLKLADGAEFHARFPEQTVLSVAPVVSFGFLTDNPAPIAVHDSTLSVPMGATLSLVGGDLTLTNSQTPLYDSSSNPSFASQLYASAGRIQLASVAGAGTVEPSLTGLHITPHTPLGTLSLTNFAVETSGVRGGDVFIRAGAFVLANSQLSSHTVGPLDGGVIDVAVDNLTLRDSDVLAYTYGAGQGADIKLNVTDTLHASHVNRPAGIVALPGGDFGGARGSSQVATLTVDLNPQQPSGDSGNIEVAAQHIELHDGANFTSSSFSQSNAGDITVEARQTFTADGGVSLGPTAVPLFAGVASISYAQGDSGAITVTAQDAKLTNGAEINASTIGLGNGGEINVHTDTLAIEGVNVSHGGESVFASAIASLAYGPGSKSGKVSIHARRLSLRDGGLINSGSGLGESAELFVHVSEELIISGVASHPLRALGFVFHEPDALTPSNIGANAFILTAGGGDGSDVQIHAKHILVEEGGTIGNFSHGEGDVGHLEVIADTITIKGTYTRSDGGMIPASISNRSNNPHDYAGEAGDMYIQANYITLQDGGQITAQAANAGGGNITVIANDLLYLNDGLINTSVSNGFGAGGNIEIYQSRLSVVNHGKIIARADVGHGGNIQLHSDYLVQTPDSLIDASSRLGIDGNIAINAPSYDLAAELAALSEHFLGVDKLLPQPCGNAAASRLVVTEQDGIGNSPMDLWAGGMPFNLLSPRQVATVQRTQQIYLAVAESSSANGMHKECAVLNS